MNKKGFTLIELLVTIVIMGLVAYMGFPSLMALINENKTKEFEYYGDLMVDAAKIYIRKEATDLQEANSFGTNGYDVPLSTLVNEEYITRYTPTKDNLECDLTDSHAFVNVTYNSSNGTYKYSYNLECKDKSSKKNYIKSYTSDEFVISNY